MISSPQKYTAAMAKLYADQGYLRKAAEIYRHLISAHSDRMDLRAALAEVERKMAARPAPTRKETELLMREWMEMVKQTSPGKRNGYEQKRKNDDEDVNFQ